MNDLFSIGCAVLAGLLCSVAAIEANNNRR